MGEKITAIMTLMAMISILCYGSVAAVWAILSAITPRVGKPNKDRLYNSFFWAMICWFVASFIVAITMQTLIGPLFFLLNVPGTILAAIGGACYSSSDDE
jgi:hypothetical protein